MQENALPLVRSAVPQLDVTGLPPRRVGNKTMGMQGYSQTFNLLYATAHVNPKRRDMGIGVRMTGQNLSAYRDLGGTESRLFEFLRGARGKASRIDIAFDLFGYNIDLQRIYADWKRGKVKCRARTVRPLTEGTREKHGGITEATTLYFGSRTSEVMIRAYDKGKEQRTDIDWTRIEIEVKGNKAIAVCDATYLMGVERVGKQLLREYFQQVPYAFWRELTIGESEPLTPVGRKATEREIWLSEVIFPLIRHEMQAEWDGCVETGITAQVEMLVREHWVTRAAAIRRQYRLT